MARKALLVGRVRWWLREGIPERVRYHWVRKNPWLHARQLDRERVYWKSRLEDCQAGRSRLLSR